jgi:hypothetical protein
VNNKEDYLDVEWILNKKYNDQTVDDPVDDPRLNAGIGWFQRTPA